jgi:hypothetical protein
MELTLILKAWKPNWLELDLTFGSSGLPYEYYAFAWLFFWDFQMQHHEALFRGNQQADIGDSRALQVKVYKALAPNSLESVAHGVPNWGFRGSSKLPFDDRSAKPLPALRSVPWTLVPFTRRPVN